VSEAGHRVLVVEDQRLIAADIENTLKKLGYVVVDNVSSGESAISKSDQLRPELVLMDVRLAGELDGIQTAEIIRDRFHVPVVYLTAYADEETILRAKKTTPFGYLVKPFNERELRATIEIALYTHQMERTLAEERARRHAAEEFKILVDGIKDYAIFMLDENGRVTTWNSGAERLTGYKADEIIGQGLSVFYTKEARQADHLRQLLETAQREGRYEGEHWRVRKDGTRLWANVIITAIRNESGTLIGFAKVTQDLTERRLAEEKREAARLRAEEAAMLRERLIAIVGHDLRNPLSSISMAAEMLSSSALATADAQLVERIQRNASRMMRMIGQILDFARIRSGQSFELRLESADLHQVCEVVIDEFRLTSPDRDIVLSIEGRADALFDSDRIAQVLSNLISNAIQHGTHGPISVTVRDALPDAAAVDVHNFGPAIPRATQASLFDAFHRETTAGNHRSSIGLGLFIAKEIVHAHGGSIAIRSPDRNGTTFSVILPRGHAESTGAQRSIKGRKLAHDNPTSAEAQRDVIVSLFKLGKATRNGPLLHEALQLAQRLEQLGRLAPLDHGLLELITHAIDAIR
jgi:PAS domain S-box-containing protein